MKYQTGANNQRKEENSLYCSFKYQVYSVFAFKQETFVDLKYKSFPDTSLVLISFSRSNCLTCIQWQMAN